MKRFLFSPKAPTGVQEVLKGLAAGKFIQVAMCMVVITEHDHVAALLDQLETSEPIESAATCVIETAGTDIQPKTVVKRAKRSYTSGPLVECKVCHKQKPVAQMCKTGQCKTCRMREIKGHSVDPVVGAGSNWGRPDSEFGPQERLQTNLARPPERIDIHKLSGRKVS